MSVVLGMWSDQDYNGLGAMSSSTAIISFRKLISFRLNP